MNIPSSALFIGPDTAQTGGYGMIKLDLPKLNWPWYKREETVGQIRRRLVEHFCPRISRTLSEPSTA
jgi:hypothetical protein